MNEVENKDGGCVGADRRGSGEEDSRYTSMDAPVRSQRRGAVEIRLRLDIWETRCCSPTSRKNLRVDFGFLPCYNKVKEKYGAYRFGSADDTERNRPRIHAGHLTAGTFKKQ